MGMIENTGTGYTGADIRVSGIRIYGYRVYGYTGIKIYGYTGIRIYGYTDTKFRYLENRGSNLSNIHKPHFFRFFNMYKARFFQKECSNWRPSTNRKQLQSTRLRSRIQSTENT